MADKNKSKTPLSFEGQLAGLPLAMLQGLTLTAGDEVLPYVTGGIDYGRNLITGQDGGSYGDLVDSRQQQQRDILSEYAEKRPLLNLLASLGGGFKIPITATARVGKGLANKAAQVATESGKAGLLGALAGFNSGEGGFENRIKSAIRGGAESAAIAAPLTAAGGVVAPVASKLGATLAGWGGAARRNSIRAGYHDYKGALQDMVASVIEPREVESFAKLAYERAIRELPRTRDARKLLGFAKEKQEQIAEEIDRSVQSVRGSVQIKPTFSRAMKMLTDAKLPADRISAEIKKLAETEALIAKSNYDPLIVHNQRMAWGDRYDLNDTSINAFYRAVYRDLNDSLRRAIPRYQMLNRKQQIWKVTEPVLQKQLQAQAADDVVKKAITIGSTTGGRNLGAILAGQALGGETGALIGGGLALATTALANPRGRDMAGEGLQIAGRRMAQGGRVFRQQGGRAGAFLPEDIRGDAAGLVGDAIAASPLVRAMVPQQPSYPVIGEPEIIPPRQQMSPEDEELYRQYQAMSDEDLRRLVGGGQ